MVKGAMFRCLPFFKESGNWQVPHLSKSNTPTEDTGTIVTTSHSGITPQSSTHNHSRNGHPTNKKSIANTKVVPPRYNGTANGTNEEIPPGQKRDTATFPSFKKTPISPPETRKSSNSTAITTIPEATPTDSLPAIDKNATIKSLGLHSGTLSRPGGKRKGIDSGVSNVDDVKIEKFEKDDRTRLMLRHAIKANDFMNNVVYKNRLELVVDCMVPEEIPADTFIIREGDPGSCFYVSAEGSFEVLKKSTPVSVFGPGIVFGELAILYKARRFASIRAITNVKVWKLDRKILQKIMREIAMNERQDNLRFLRSVETFEKYDREVLGRIADLLKRELYVGGSRIIRQGDSGDKFFIIRGGTVTITKVNSEGVEKKIRTLAKGAYFGEKALLSDEKRTANIYANPPGTECLVLDKESFLKHVNVKSFASPRPNQVRLSSTRLVTEYSHIKLSDLRIVGTLGEGGFGRVELVEYRGKAGSAGRSTQGGQFQPQTFALKYLKKIDMVAQQQQEHVFNEKNMMAKCDNSFIVKLYNTYKDTRYLYFLMEPCLGGDLWGVLQKHKCFDEKTSVFFAGCIVLAFEYLHEKNIIYRDLKPENLMLDNKGYLKLIDFGFAKYLMPGEKSWTFAGTPEYVAPEIILNKGHDRSVDYWALGVFIHELMCGVPPFRGKDHLKTYTKILRGIESADMDSRISRSAKDLIRRLLKQNPPDRLGNQKDGVEDIKKHAFFSKFDFQKLSTQQIPAPLVKSVKNNYDLSNFDHIPKNHDEPPEEFSGWDKDF